MSEQNYSVIGVNGKEEIVVGSNVDFQTAIELFIDSESSFDKVNIIQDYDVLYRADNLLIMSDCEMMLDELKELLIRPSGLKEQFVFLGNFISAHSGFYDFMTYLVKLKHQKKENCVFVKGINEYNLLEYIHQTEQYIGDPSAVAALVSAIEADLTFSLYTLKERFPEFYDLLNDALPYYENDQYIFVAAGLSLDKPNWKNSTPEELYTMTDQFFDSKNTTNKTIVYGTTPARCFNSADVIRPYIDENKHTIAINGECRDKGKLIGLLLLDGDRYFISVRNKTTRKIAYAY